MCDAASELTDGLHLLRMKELLAGPLQFYLSFASFSQVTGNLGEADQLTIVVDGVNHHARPESAAVFPDAPALGLVAPLPLRRFQRPPRHAGLDVLLRVKPGKMLADDFGCRVTLDSLGARIP